MKPSHQTLLFIAFIGALGAGAYFAQRHQDQRIEAIRHQHDDMAQSAKDFQREIESIWTGIERSRKPNRIDDLRGRWSGDFDVGSLRIVVAIGDGEQNSVAMSWTVQHPALGDISDGAASVAVKSLSILGSDIVMIGEVDQRMTMHWEPLSPSTLTVDHPKYGTAVCTR